MTAGPTPAAGGPAVSRVLARVPVESLDAYRATGGGTAVDEARAVEPETVIELVAASGLRGRGGAGFPTGRKWRTVHENTRGAAEPPTVVVNGAEGEPGSFKDRTLVRVDPYRVVEGALIAAHAMGAPRIVFAVKETFGRERARLDEAVAAVRAAGWARGVTLEVFGGPSEYLYGEETGLLEALDGRLPFPRVDPPFRRGVEDDLVDGPDAEADKSAARTELAGPTTASTGAPALVDNVETIANLCGIVRHGDAWFRELGTEASPGTIVCTVSGDAPRHGVAEFAMGTPLGDVLRHVGGVELARVGAVLSGVSNAWLTPDRLDVPLTYEDVAATGSGLGTAGFIVVDRDTDLLAVAAGIARFLAVESCGQCTPCKEDGRRIGDALAEAVRGDAPEAEARDRVARALATVADGARCNLAAQQQAAVGVPLTWIPVRDGRALPDGREAVPDSIAPIRDLVDGRFVLDERQATKQPDWSHGPVDSGRAPADRFATDDIVDAAD